MNRRETSAMRAFWNAATALDTAARDLTEDRRFPFCTPGGLTALATGAGLMAVEVEPIEAPTVFKDFEDYWRPFTLGAGPAPCCCESLSPTARERLKEKLQKDLPRDANGAIPMKARAAVGTRFSWGAGDG